MGRGGAGGGGHNPHDGHNYTREGILKFYGNGCNENYILKYWSTLKKVRAADKRDMAMQIGLDGCSTKKDPWILLALSHCGTRMHLEAREGHQHRPAPGGSKNLSGKKGRWIPPALGPRRTWTNGIDGPLLAGRMEGERTMLPRVLHPGPPPHPREMVL